MPYARTYGTRARRPRRPYRARRPGATRFARKPLKSKVWTNRTVANRSLALAQRAITMSYGQWQQSLHHWEENVTLNAFTPICFNLTTPTVGEPVHQYLPSGPGTYNIDQITTFQVPPLGQLTGEGPSGGGYEPWNQWRNSSDVLNGKYKLLTTKLCFHIQAPTSTSCRIRIDFVKPRYNRQLRFTQPLIASQGDNHLLPDSLGSFVNLLDVNMINPLYWRTIKTVYKTIAPANNLTTTKTQKSVFFRLNKVINPITTTATSIFPSAKVSLNNQIWCIVSTDFRGGSTSGQPSVNVTRHTTWRDAQGHAA